MKIKSNRISVIIALITGILIILTVSLSGCKNSSTESSNDLGKQADKGAEKTSAGQSASDENDKVIKLTEADGTEVVFDKVPEKIVVLSYGTATIMDALGIELVGMASTRRELTETLKKPVKVGSPMRPDMEQLLALDPDLVIISSSFKGAQQKTFADNGLKTYFIKNQAYYDTVKSIKMLGDFFGREEKAAALIKDIEIREKKILEGIKGKTPPKVLVIFGTTQSFQMATKHSYAGNMVEILGGNNIASGLDNSENSYLPLSIENVVEQNPDIIFRTTHGSWEKIKDSYKSEFESNELWSTVNAVKNGRTYDLDPNMFHANPGMKIVDALEYLANIMYPEKG